MASTDGAAVHAVKDRALLLRADVARLTRDIALQLGECRALRESETLTSLSRVRTCGPPPLLAVVGSAHGAQPPPGATLPCNVHCA